MVPELKTGLTFDFLSDDRVAQLQILSGSNLVEGLHPEVVLAVDVEVLDSTGQDVLSRHDGHVGLLGGLTALQGVAGYRGATIILRGFPADLAGVLGGIAGGDVFALTGESCRVQEGSKNVSDDVSGERHP